MAEQQLKGADVGARFEQMDRERAGRSECGLAGLDSPERQCANWHARATVPVVIGTFGSSSGKSQCRGRRHFHHSRKISSGRGESMT